MEVASLLCLREGNSIQGLTSRMTRVGLYTIKNGGRLYVASSTFFIHVQAFGKYL